MDMQTIDRSSTTESKIDSPNEIGLPPGIGESWMGGIYAGISRGESGDPDAHVVLLTNEPDKDLNWNDAVEWAKAIGDGARLPTRFESALLYANLHDQLNTDEWHWTGTLHSDSDAWSQLFHDGNQGDFSKSYEVRARAVRRFPL